MKKRSFKKLSAILAVAMIIAAIAPLSAQADAGDKFTVGNFEYVVDVEASGSNLGEAWLTKYKASFGNVVIPATVANASNSKIYEVRAIDHEAFADKSITGVSIPSTVKTIINNAFNNCASLTNVIFEPGSKLTDIGGNAFEGCRSIVSIDLPNSLEFIYGDVFSGCTSLKSIDIPASVEFIDRAAFDRCSSLKVVIFNSLIAPSINSDVLRNVAANGVIYYPANDGGYDDRFFEDLLPDSLQSGWSKIVGRPQSPSGGSGIFEQVNMFADVSEADIPGFGRDFRVSGEITNAPGVPESVVLRVSTPSPEFTSNKAANAAYSDALLHGQPVAFNALEVVDAVSGQAYVLPEGAKAQLKFELDRSYADKAITISQYDAAGELIERFDVTCDDDGSAVINASGLGLFVITREWI